jgi:glutamate/aspartate transport system substrate-binding protein
VKNLIQTLFALASIATLGQAALAEGTLDKIAKTGEIAIGYRDSSAPLSYVDASGRPLGYQLDICMKTVEELSKKIGKPLKVNFVPVDGSNRIPLVVNGTVDLECGSTTNNTARQTQVAFAPTTYVTTVRVVVKKDSGIKGLPDLAGKAVATTSGTTSVQLLRARNGAAMRFKEVFGKDHADSFMLLETDRASAFVMDDNTLAGLVANSKNPAEFAIVGEGLSVEPIAIMMRKGDPAFSAAVDESVKGQIQRGDVARLYTKWFLSPIPPRGANVKLSMGPELKAALANPNALGTEDLAKIR